MVRISRFAPKPYKPACPREKVQQSGSFSHVGTGMLSTWSSINCTLAAVNKEAKTKRRGDRSVEIGHDDLIG